MSEYRRTGDREMRNRVLEAHLDIADHFARRYGRRGVPEEDLRQIGVVAMLRAVDRFEPEQGVTFATFAGRTVEGELKRWFRDRSWAVRPPRRAQELHLEVRRAVEELSHRIGRSPTVAELAREVGADEDEVLEALEAGAAHRATSLDAPAAPDDDRTVGDRALGSIDGGYGQVDARLTMEEALSGLPEREQEILRLRFYDRLSQPEIAERIGVSQSYLSRLLRRTLASLRETLEESGVEGHEPDSSASTEDPRV